ncbi:Pectin lyase fold/virulence factor [Penicillium canariense]|uniref:Pectin lyase fold/virulence factor n=1 Tax=Penicillium canariense TaxID=189055 RepID=A0A9W9HND6_9EURO|nr:Pectin lyase fold/virulence factor [Penicillium canariense]KAJ5152681.1 Pectin lyase fold/virulence factor [Penicillium canariense]
MDYNVVNDGSGDQTPKLQKAIDDDGNGGTRKGSGVTRHPAEVFLPGGIYQLGSTLTLTVGTIIVGDPRNPPIIRASPYFQGEFLIMGYDKNNGNPETSFMMLMKNVILDTATVPTTQSITALQWGVAQGAGLTNIQIRMPTGSSLHTGINIVAGSTIAVTDVTIIGGATGIINSNQQVNFKNVHFISCGTAFEAAGGFTVLLQSAFFESCGTGINMTSNALGSLVILDSVSTNSGPFIRFYDSSHDTGNQNSQLLIQNLEYNSKSPIAVDTNGHVRLEATAHVDTWVWGTMVPGAYVAGAEWTTQRSPQLLVNGRYFTKPQPTYARFSGDDIVNVKTAPGQTAKGDGVTDDTAALNAILARNAANCKITYIPFGVYRVSDTIHIPVGSRIVGEAWPVISAYGDTFKDPASPRAVVRLGNPGDVGLIEIQDMRFSVGEILPGAKVVEINAAGQQPGDVGLWNSLVMIGGTAETSISDVCTSQDPKDCMAAFMVMHLTETSSAYIENFWGWTADHNLDSKSLLTIVSTGRGILVESTKGTWLTGTGSEHHWLYNYNFHRAANVYAGLLQSESPYMQGSGEFEKAPAPWTADAQLGDPDFSWCGADDDKCRTALATNVDGGSNIALYNSAAWAFFDGYWNGLYNEPCQGKCQANMMRVTGAPQNLVWYSIGTRQTDVMVLDGKSNPRETDHAGGWEAIIQAYGEFAA